MEKIIVSKSEVGDYLNQIPVGFSHGMLFSGDRYSCVDEYVVLHDRGKLIGIASIAPYGEQTTGIPSIVGLWVSPEFRGQGFGFDIFKASIERCLLRFPNQKIRIDALVKPILKMCDRLPQDVRDRLQIEDFSNFPCFFD